MAKFIALIGQGSDEDPKRRLPLTVNGRLIVDAEAALSAVGLTDLVRVPANTLGSPVSMLDSPLAKVTAWWQDEDARDGDQSA
jgi:hypothetical protein